MNAKPACTIAVIGGGPAGLFAAEHLAKAGHAVTVYDRMPTLGRKFLMAGRGGLNLTHSEPFVRFKTRYRDAEDWLSPFLDAFTPNDMRDWANALQAETFVGSSGRVFPKVMKASPLLRAWRVQLEALGVVFALRHQWTGWTDKSGLSFDTPDGWVESQPDAVVLALGGASWPRLGSDAAWVPWLASKGVDVAAFQASNAGVEIGWSDILRQRFAGQPLKTIALDIAGERVRGEAILTDYGLEGGAVYALSNPIREALMAGKAELVLDLKPDQDVAALAVRLKKRRKGESLANRLRKAGLTSAAAGLVREAGSLPTEPEALAKRIKSISVPIERLRGLDRAISSAGGVTRDAVDDRLMLKAIPGVFIAGEMLDWDAPTGGYLLQASFATAKAAATGLMSWLSEAGR